MAAEINNLPGRTMELYNQNWEQASENIAAEKEPYGKNWDELSNPTEEYKNLSKEPGGWDNPRHYSLGKPNEAQMRSFEGKPFYEDLVRNHQMSSEETALPPNPRPLQSRIVRTNVWGIPKHTKIKKENNSLSNDPLKSPAFKSRPSAVPLWSPPANDPVMGWLSQKHNARPHQEDIANVPIKQTHAPANQQELLVVPQIVTPLAAQDKPEVKSIYDEPPKRQPQVTSKPSPIPRSLPSTTSSIKSSNNTSVSEVDLPPTETTKKKSKDDPNITLDWEITGEDELGSKGLASPNDVTFLDDKQIAISDEKNSRIVIFDIKGDSFSVIDNKKCPKMQSPLGLTVTRKNPQYLAVADTNRVNFLDANRGAFVDYFGFEEGTSVRNSCINNLGQMIIIDLTYKPSVYLYSVKGKLKRKLKIPKKNFESPNYITTNTDGTKIYLSDEKANAVYMFSNKGKYICTIGASEGEDSLVSPQGVAVNSNGQIYVADAGNNKIRKYSSDGTFIHALLPNEGFTNPTGIAVNSTNLVVAWQNTKEKECGIKVYQI